VQRDLPSGTVTFLFTDVEGSTTLLHDLGADGYAAALAEHRRVVREACSEHGGVEVDTQGDAFLVAFSTAPGALAAAATVTEELEPTPVRVRIGLHTGTPLATGEGYVGADVHRAARIAASGHGGQVLVSVSTASLVERDLLLDLGEHRLKDLSAPERIYQLGDGEFAPLTSLHHTNLPVPTTPFLGREKELADVGGLLSRTNVRLLTLTGPGGIGKTRLAAQAAGLAAGEYPDGVWWVPLDTLRDPIFVFENAAQALGAKQELQAHIGDKRMLILFDGFERVLGGALGIATLQSACPNLKLLVTSRERLHLTGEQEYAVPPLAHQEAVGFFAERARAVKHDFESDAAVSEICNRLDDIPLALELAAAQVKVLSTRQMLERGLPLSTSGPRDLPDRQRTLRTTIEWSYELLSDLETQLFRRLAVFAGGFTLEAAEEIAGAELDTLQSLVEKSLLQFSNERYWMLQTIREYALEQLEHSGERQDLRHRHADWFLAFAQARGPAGAPTQHRIGALRAELENFRAAMGWLRAAGARQLELELAISLFELWIMGGYASEGRRVVQDALAGAAHPSELQAKALKAAGDLALDHGDYVAAQELLEQALRLHRGLGDERIVARCLTDLGHVAKCERDYSRAETLFEESTELARGLHDEEVLAEALLNHGDFLVSSGDFARAELLCRESLALYQGLGSDLGAGNCRYSLALACLHQHRSPEAFDLLREALTVFVDFDYAVAIGSSFEAFAALAVDQGRCEEAAQLMGAAEVLLESAGASLEPGERALHEQTITTIRSGIGQGRLADLWTQGRTMSIDDAVQCALSS